jgi:hypothetical protein
MQAFTKKIYNFLLNIFWNLTQVEDDYVFLNVGSIKNSRKNEKYLLKNPKLIFLTKEKRKKKNIKQMKKAKNGKNERNLKKKNTNSSFLPFGFLLS